MNASVGKTWITLFLTWLFIFILMMCWYVKCQLKYFYFKGSSQKILSLPRFVNLLSIPANWKLLIFSRKKKKNNLLLIFSVLPSKKLDAKSHHMQGTFHPNQWQDCYIFITLQDSTLHHQTTIAFQALLKVE